MFLREVLFLSIQFSYVFLVKMPMKIPATPCKAGAKILNDCNWCTCNVKGTFDCEVRNCGGVDMFGHFNDAIRDINVGMEGHGAWRTRRVSSCQPGMQYRRPGLVCVCDATGSWPNPVCRDMFRILYEVIIPEEKLPSSTDKCNPHELYLYGCNVCVCPDAGNIDPEACTKKNCTDDVHSPAPNVEEDEKTEIYAQCELDRKYSIGCKKCVCLKNNRLLCDKCENQRADSSEASESICSKYKPNEVFYDDCNACLCDDDDNLYCTAKNCLKEQSKPLVDLSKSAIIALNFVEPPIDESSCTPGTKYKIDCNTCHCTLTANQQKVLSCTLKKCRESTALAKLTNDCVGNTVYESNCLVCRCDVIDGVKTESCLVSSKCSQERDRRIRVVSDLNTLNGYCEPSFTYDKDCNSCRCLPNGKVLKCTSEVCPKIEEPLVADIIPITQRGGKPCPKDHMYSVGCNFCFCLSTGNLLCTTAKCDKNQ